MTHDAIDGAVDKSRNAQLCNAVCQALSAWEVCPQIWLQLKDRDLRQRGSQIIRIVFPREYAPKISRGQASTGPAVFPAPSQGPPR